MASIWLYYGEFLTEQGKHAAGEEALNRAVAIWYARKPERNWRLAAARSALGDNLARQGRCDSALPLLTESRAELAEIRGATNRYTRLAASRLERSCDDDR